MYVSFFGFAAFFLPQHIAVNSPILVNLEENVCKY